MLLWGQAFILFLLEYCPLNTWVITKHENFFMEIVVWILEHWSNKIMSVVWGKGSHLTMKANWLCVSSSFKLQWLFNWHEVESIMTEFSFWGELFLYILRYLDSEQYFTLVEHFSKASLDTKQWTFGPRCCKVFFRNTSAFKSWNVKQPEFQKHGLNTSSAVQMAHTYGKFKSISFSVQIFFFK